MIEGQPQPSEPLVQGSGQFSSLVIEGQPQRLSARVAGDLEFSSLVIEGQPQLGHVDKLLTQRRAATI